MASPIVKHSDIADTESDEYDEESEEEDYAAPANDPVRVTFDEIIRKVKQRELKLRSKDDRKYFVDQYGKQLKATTNTDKRNLLHMLAYETSNKALVKLLVLRHPELMEMVDDSNKTAFYIAISRKNIAVLMSMYENYTEIDKVLGMKYEHSENGMHAAIRYKLSIDVIIDLVRQASPSTLCAQDQMGRTPLHLAVEYERCTNSQLRLVREFITRDDGALDLFTTRPPLSVYQYHEDTRQRAQRKTDARILKGHPGQSARAEASRIGVIEAAHSSKSTTAKAAEEDERKVNTGNGKSDSTGSGLFEGKSGRGSKAKEASSALERRDTGSSPKTNGEEPSAGPDLETNYKANEARQYRNEARLRSVMTPGEPQEVANLAAQGAGYTPQAKTNLESLKDIEKASVSSSARKDVLERVHQREEIFTEKAADEVKEELKLHFLRSTFKGRGHDEAVRFLHGNNTKDIQISFDVFETLQSIEEDDFEESFENISFDKVLRYVALGKVSVKRPTVASKFMRKQPRKGRGRSDLGFIFNWLYQKGVKQILKVIVDDLEDPAHSDEAIENALERFNVEILDWRKVDLCPETIHKACKSLREVHLRWSGNNAILRAWSEREGLAGLEHLRKVHLHVRPGLESADRTTSNIDRFQERLRHYRSDILVDVYRIEEGQSETLVLTAPSKPNGDTKDEASLYPHKWLETMDQFADQIQNVHQPTSKHDALNEPVKVALIDDGVDIYHPSLRRKVYSGTTFDNGYPNGDRPIPFYVTSTGHGTVMANMICRVFPTAKLYVFKLETRPGSDSNITQITARSAADAVDAAVARNVHIISMSWTIKETEENGNDIRRLEAAMNEASKKGILMFCAAGDKGAHQDKEYPAAYNPTRIFRIGAAKADGNVWAWAGDPRNLDFILPGHEVVDRNPHGAPLEKFRQRTGSSVATALAAGLAALVLHCVRLSAIHTDTLGPTATKSAVAISDFHDLKKHDSMKAAFKAIGTSDESHNKFVEVWRHFSKAEEALRRSDQPGKLEIVANLARNLIRKT